MPLIPITYVPAALILIYVGNRLGDRTDEKENVFYLGFLTAVALTLILIGSRFGYGLDCLKIWQPLIAATIAPLAYLSFCDPEQLKTRGKWKVALPLISVIAIKAIAIHYPDLIDASLAFNGFLYCGLLIRQGLLGQDGLSWKGLNQAKKALVILWSEVIYLIVAASVDMIVAYDFWKNNGQNLETIVARVPFIIALIAIGLWLIRRANKPGPKMEPKGEDQIDDSDLDPDSEKYEIENFRRIEQFVEQTGCYLDPNLSINLIARKLGLPARKISEAINHQTGASVSVFINRYRISSACEKLKNGDSNITEIMYQSGFNTKSNFNREFKRVTGQPPSAWRSANTKTPIQQ